MPIDYKTYPTDWFSRIVPAIHKRANHCCEECGLEDGQIVYSVKIKATRKGKTVYRRLWLQIDPKLSPDEVKRVQVVLTVAHLDHDEWNHKVLLERLKLLCQRCHLRYDAPIRAQRKACDPYCNFPTCQTHFPHPFCAR